MSAITPYLLLPLLCAVPMALMMYMMNRGNKSANAQPSADTAVDEKSEIAALRSELGSLRAEAQADRG